MTREIELLVHQAKFAQSNKRYVALVGGFGSGKSFGLATKLFNLAYQNKGFNGLLLNRSYRQLMDALVPEVIKLFTQMGWQRDKQYRFKDKNKLVITWSKGVESVIHLYSTEMGAYERLAGFNVAFALVDEIDTIPKASEVWRFVNHRVRERAPVVQTACSSTPEGFGFLYDFFDKQVQDNPDLAEERELIRACTLDNPHLSDDFVTNLINTHDPKSLRAYIFGEFVSLSGSRAYWGFSELSYTNKTLTDFSDRPLHIGIDFNANVNATEVSIIDNYKVYVVDEIFGCRTVEDLMNQIDSRYGNRPKFFYPDYAGFEGIEQLKRRYGVDSVKTCPKDIKERVASVNFLIKNGENRRFFVNPEKCPNLTKTLNYHTLDATGFPDKKSGLDHAGDAVGYLIHTMYPYKPKTAQSSAPRF